MFNTTAFDILLTTFTELKTLKRELFYQHRIFNVADFEIALVNKKTGIVMPVLPDLRLHTTIDAEPMTYVFSIHDRICWFRCYVVTAFYGRMQIGIEVETSTPIEKVKKSLFLTCIRELQKRGIFKTTDFTESAESLANVEPYFSIHMFNEQYEYSITPEHGTKLILDLLDRKWYLGAYFNIWELQ